MPHGCGREGVNRGEIKIYCGWLHRLELRKVNNFCFWCNSLRLVREGRDSEGCAVPHLMHELSICLKVARKRVRENNKQKMCLTFEGSLSGCIWTMNLKWKRIAIHVECDFIELIKLREIALGIRTVK